MKTGELKVFGISDLEKEGFDFETLTYSLLGKGKYVVCEYDDGFGWFPMCGENRFTTKKAANIAILDRIQMKKEIDNVLGEKASDSSKMSLEEALAFADRAVKNMEEEE